MKAVIRSANRNTTLSKEFSEPAYNVEPVREKKFFKELINILSFYFFVIVTLFIRFIFRNIPYLYLR
jgi:hypothetical protein